MARFSGGILATGIGSTTLPMASLFAGVGVRFILREVHVFNTTSTEVDIALRIMTAQGTAGAAGDEVEHDAGGPSPTATLLNTHTVAPTFTTGNVAEARLAAAIGAAIIWTFNDGIYIPGGTTNGVGVVLNSGTGQICSMTFIWDE
jgi:hypothetical protein